MSDPRVALFRLLDAGGLWRRTLDLKRGAVLTATGSTDRSIYYVERGTLVSTVELEGAAQCLRFGYAGDFLTALDAHLAATPTRFTTRALRKCRLREVPYARFRDHLHGDADHLLLWQEIMAWLIRGQLEREIDLLVASPEERYRRVLARSPRLFQEIPAKYIANYLRMSPETLSRIKKS